jgi:UDP-N-acetylmuramoylalanine--D-glutamate ligase
MAGRVLVVGLGINNRPLLPFLAAQGLEVVAADQRDASAIDLDRSLAAAWYLGPDYLEEALKNGPYEAVYLTPGMRKDIPQVRALATQGARLTCETDLFLGLCPAPVIGITGSAGKTTTTTLVGECLTADGSRPVFVGGNIGVPLLPRLSEITADSWVVMELSSFQLELTEHSPHGAAVLNLAENHLDIHGSMEAYSEAKSRIFRHQTPEDWLVMPEPPPDAIEPWLKEHRGRRLAFSEHGPVDRGAFLSEGVLWWQPGSGPRPVLGLTDWHIPGAMNVRNALAAIAIALSAGGSLEAAAAALANFRGVPHRLELVAEHGGVRYVNDSIATAPQRTLAALEAVAGPLVMILGGYDKHLDYRELGRAVAGRAHTVVLVGQVAEKIAAALHAGPQVVRAATFEEAVGEAVRRARPGDTVLLSPAAASYDMFRNFEERGERFRALVREELETYAD